MRVSHWKNLLLLLACVSATAASQELDLDDLEGRIDYAWFTEDVNSLRNLIQSAESAVTKGGDSAMARYELGFAHYRLGLLLLQKSDAGAGSAMEKCVDELDLSLKADEHSAEAYALQGACYGALAGIRPWKAMVHGPQSTTRIEKARKLAPDNPRVVLLDGVADREKPKAFGGDPEGAATKVRRAVELFENGGATESGRPRWGAADAYFYLGRGLRQAADTLGARNALERALIIAPEFAAARRELRRLTAPAG